MRNRSKIFSAKIQEQIEGSVISLINGEKDLMSATTIDDPRAVGGVIQKLLGQEFKSLLPKDILKEYIPSFPRRSMADFAFTDNDGFSYMVDCKTHNLDTVFNMPNLTSVERLARFYEDDANYFTLLMVAYKVNGNKLTVQKCHFVPIEHLDWQCLTIGALGWGQIQIANSNNISIDPKQTRKKWMIQLCKKLAEFYPKEIKKISRRRKYFERTHKYWGKHPNF